MKIRSAYVDKELDFDVMEKLDPVTNKTVLVIKHDSLRDVIYNQLNITAKGDVSYNYVSSDVSHAVVECTISDGNGRIVKEVGESVPATLENDIARAYPVLVASQRAFDRAAILLLKLAGKQFSNQEIGEYIPVDFEPAIYKENVVNDNGVLVDVPVEPIVEAPIPVDEMMYIPEGVGDMEEVEEAEEEVVVQDPVEEDTTIDFEARAKELGEKVFNIGKYAKNPTTIAQLYKTDVGYLRSLLKIAKPADSLKQALADIKEYLQIVES